MIFEAAHTGDRRATLEAIRDKLARDMDDAPSAVSAQLAGQLVKVLAELAEMGDPKKVSALDELADKRKDRLAASGIPEPPRRQARQRRG